MLRRNFLRTALSLPFAGAFATFARLTAAETGKTKITGMKLKPISRIGHTLILHWDVQGDGEVTLVDRVAGELAQQAVQHRPVLGAQHHAAGILVEAMHVENVRAELGVDLVHQVVEALVPAVGRNQQPGGLVQRDEVVILVQDAQTVRMAHAANIVRFSAAGQVIFRAGATTQAASKRNSEVRIQESE